MFVRADKLLGPRTYPTIGYHVIDFEWEGYEPLLFWYVEREGHIERADLKEIEWKVSSNKRCIGRSDEKGYHRCPDSMPVSRFAQCPRCSAAWIGHQECIFEPMCAGERCGSTICGKEHTVYMAFFGESAKVGMTTSSRLEERGIEQGADAIVPLVMSPNRMEGRRAEKEISMQLDVTQQISRKKAVSLLARPVMWDKLEQTYERFLKILSRKMDVLGERLIRLDGYPLKGLQGRKVDLVPTEGAHKGKVLGLKGKFLVYLDEEGRTCAMEASDLPGRHISAK
ncbi:MAG: DUF2797 domain-containing protein [Methanomassiliicoccales archaeon]|nr:MAG: DUF2797 domain-containing protein [Methanomassiliicoccales archaeon]